MRELADWYRRGLAGPDPGRIEDDRVTWLDDGPTAALRAMPGPLHAILLHLDAVPAVHDGSAPGPSDDPRWLAAACATLHPGGLLALGAVHPQPRLTRDLRKAGFDVAESSVHGSPGARRPRPQPLWFARKPGR